MIIKKTNKKLLVRIVNKRQEKNISTISIKCNLINNRDENKPVIENIIVSNKMNIIINLPHINNLYY